MAPTTLFVLTWLHMSTKTAMMSSRPQKNWYVHLNGFAGSPLRPKNQACHGTSVTMHGIPFASQTSDTGFVVIGVLETSIRSTLSSRIRFCATVAPRFAFDCESRSRISTGKVFLPTRMPLLNSFCISLTVYLFDSPKLASGPVSGETQPILIVRVEAKARLVAT